MPWKKLPTNGCKVPAGVIATCWSLSIVSVLQICSQGENERTLQNSRTVFQIDAVLRIHLLMPLREHLAQAGACIEWSVYGFRFASEVRKRREVPGATSSSHREES